MSASAPAAPPTVAFTQPPQQDPPALVYGRGVLGQLSAGALVVWDTATWTSARVPVEGARGLGALRDGALLVVDAPASLAGQVRLQQVAAGQVTATQGAIPAGLGGPVWVLPGAEPAQLSLLSFASPATLAQVDLSLQPLLQRVVRLSGYDAPVAVGLDDGAALLPVGGGLQRIGPDGAVRDLPLPDAAQAPTLLAPGGPGALWLTTRAMGPQRLLLAPTPQVQDAVSTDAPVFHLAGDALGTAALLLAQDPATNTATWRLSVQGAPGTWQTPIERPQRAADTWVALSAAQVAVGGAAGFGVWDRATGARLR